MTLALLSYVCGSETFPAHRRNLAPATFFISRLHTDEGDGMLSKQIVFICLFQTYDFKVSISSHDVYLQDAHYLAIIPE